MKNKTNQSKKNVNKKRRAIFNFVERHIEANTLSAVLMFIVIACIFIDQLANGKFDFGNFVDTQVLLSFIIVAICGIAANVVKKFVEKKCEDYAKLEKDYDSLNKKYNVNKLIQLKKEDNISLFPVVCMAMKDKDYVDIEIVDNKGKKYTLPTQVSEHSEEIMRVHKQSKLYNNINIRLDGIELKNGNVVINTSRTTYFDSMITNRAMDYQWNNRKTIREIYEPGPYISELEESRMSNHLGFNGFVETTDGNIIFVLRKNDVSIGKNTLADSIGASLKTKYAIDDKYNLTLEGIGKSIISEIKEELGIDIVDEALKNNKELEHPIDVDSIINKINNIAIRSIISFYRDLVEGGKPQFLFYLKLSDIDKCFDDEYVYKHFEANREDINKLKIKSKENKMKIDGNKFILLNINELRRADIEAGKIVINRENVKEYEMMPSASACIVMLMEYMQIQEEKN